MTNAIDTSPVWPVQRHITLTRRRVLPAGQRGVVLVATDDPVEPDQAVAQGPDDAKPVVAGMRGRVASIVPGRGAVITGQAAVARGLIGFGPEVFGPLVFWPLGNSSANAAVAPGTILVVAGELTDEIWSAAVAGGAAGIIAGSASPTWITELTGAECTALLDNSLPAARPPALALMLAHGFGVRPLGREFWQLLAGCNGQSVLLSPATDLARGQRPEVILSMAPASGGGRVTASLEAGAPVWVLGGEFDGATGRVVRILRTKQVMPSGLHAPAVRVALDTGGEVIVPQANVQRVG
jgi:hypothetical protein